MEHINNFLDFLDEIGCPPESASDIRADDTWRDYQIKGDTDRKKKGYYVLTLEGNDATGAAGDRRTGVTHQYRGKPLGKLSDKDRREYAIRMEAKKKEKEAIHLKANEATAKLAKKQWEAATQSPHPYLEEKGITPEFTRVDSKGFLLIPLYADHKLWNVQSIDANGGKLFKKNGRKQGCYMPLAKAGESKDVLYICEGFATGKSIREATGGMVLVAFDCGNLIHVAKDKRTENPQSKIVICADNDAHKEVNAGLEAAIKAAEEIGGYVAYPEFMEGDEGTDYNDFMRHYGEDALCKSLENCESYAKEVMQGEEWFNELPPVDAYDEETREEVSLYEDKSEQKGGDEWKSFLAKDSNGKLKPKSLNNVSLMLDQSPKFRDMFCFDEFADEKKIVQCPPWENADKFKPRALTDEDNTWLCCELEKHGLTLGMQSVSKILDAVVTKKVRNPAQEYFNNLVWDGKERLGTWLKYYAGCEFDDEKYVSEVGKKFMTAIVSRVMRAGCKFDHVLILEGNQGVGKSRLLKALSTIHGKAYFTDSLKAKDLGTDAAVTKTQGVLIVELAELSELSKTDMDIFKQQITIQEDRIVRKYANEATNLPRKFVIVGSINPKDGYLDDPTGLRRFWPVKTGANFRVEELKKDREQLFAEAMQLYRDGYPLYLDDEMAKQLSTIQESRRLVAPWMPDLEELSENKDFIIQREIWETLNFEKSRRNTRDMAAIAKIMTELGFEQGRKTMGGKKLTGWKRKI